MYNYNEAVEQTIIAGEQIHQIVNGTATTEVTVADGSKIPSIRKALLDNFYFKNPLPWQQGQTEVVFNQLRQFTDGTLWYAPTATVSNPVNMGINPNTQPEWRLFSWDRIIDSQKASRKLIERSWGEAGYNIVNGSFQEGGVLNNGSDTLILYGNPLAVYKWNGVLPKVVPTGSTPNDTGGLSSNAWVEVNSLLKDLTFPALTYALNNSLAEYKGPNIIQAEVGTFVTPTTSGFPPLSYMGSVYHPPYNLFNGFTIQSLALSLWGELIVTTTTGQSLVWSRDVQINEDRIVFGEEYLERFNRSINLTSGTNNPSKQPIKIVLSGDSTTVGVGATSDAFKPHIQLQSIASAMGYSYINVINKGVSGGSTFQWKDLWIAGELAENPDLLILRWGVNDPATPTTTVASFEQSLREGLATIRAQKSVAELSIILMTPCTTDNDAGTRRVTEWHVAINRVIRRAARDYMCCFIDTHKAFMDAKNSAGIWMDDVDPTSTRVHPLDILYTKISQLIGQVIFPQGNTLSRTNCIFNVPTYAGEYTGQEDSSAFSSGVTMQRIVSTDPNQPLNGFCTTIKHCEGAAVQIVTPLYGVTAGKQISFRSSYKNNAVTGSLGNTLFTGIEYAPSLQNGWVYPSGGFRPLRYKFGVDGELKLVGTIQPGTLTAGTVLFNITNPYLRPDAPVVIICSADVVAGQQLGQATVNPNGNVVYNGPTSGVYRIHINGIVPL